MRLRLAQNICCLVLFFCAAIPSFAQCPFPAPNSAIVLTYTFDPIVEGNQMTLRVTLEFNGNSKGTDKLILPSDWAGQQHLENSIGEIKALSAGTTIADTSSPSEKLIRFSPNTLVRISYVLKKDWEGPLNGSTRFRADLSPSYFHLVGTSSLVYPKLKSFEPVDARFNWQQLPPTWSLATSFGADNRCQSFHGLWTYALNSLFVGGDYRIRRTGTSGHALIFAIRGQWSFTDDQWITDVTRIVEFERRFWHDDNFPYLLVTLTPVDKERGDTGGTALTNAFMMHLSRQDDLPEETLAILAHEEFHLWNPDKIGLPPGSDFPVSWFFEGFTLFYQDVMLLRAGVIDFPTYLEVTNRKLQEYALSDGVNATLADFIRTQTAHQSALDQLDYKRGAVLALWLDSTIRARTENKSSLDDLMFRMVDQNSQYEKLYHHPLLLTNRRIFHTVSQMAGGAIAKSLRKYVEKGGTIPIPENALGPCAQSHIERIPRFDLGFDIASLTSPQKIISGVEPNSEAYKAGVRDGQQAQGWSIYGGDISKQVRVTIKVPNGKRNITYYPRGAEAPVQQFSLDQTKYAASPSQCSPR